MQDKDDSEPCQLLGISSTSIAGYAPVVQVFDAMHSHIFAVKEAALPHWDIG